jgi:hypothetical protein
LLHSYSTYKDSKNCPKSLAIADLSFQQREKAVRKEAKAEKKVIFQKNAGKHIVF